MSKRVTLTLTAAQSAYLSRRAVKLNLDVPKTLRRLVDSDMLKEEGIIPEWFVPTNFSSWLLAQQGRGDNVGVAARYCRLAGDLSGPKAFCVWVAKQKEDNAWQQRNGLGTIGADPPPENAVEGLKDAIREWQVTRPSRGR